MLCSSRMLRDCAVSLTVGLAGWALFAAPMMAAETAAVPAPAKSQAETPPAQPTRWRDAWGKAEVVQRIRPEYNDAYINNPHKGTTTFQRFNGDPLYPGMRWDDSKGPMEFLAPANADLSNDHYPPTRVSYCRWPWKAIEPEKGKIRFDILDAALKTAHDRGQTLQLRIEPWAQPEDAPDWYYTMGGTRQGRPTTRPAAVAAVPPTPSPTTAPTTMRVRRPRLPEADCNNPLYLQHWGDLIRALGKRYDGHPDLESFDVAYGGQWGEGGGNATYQTASKLVDVYCEAFKKTDLILMLSTPGCKYASTLKDRHFGWRADCFGDMNKRSDGTVPAGLNWNHMYDAYPQSVEEDGLRDAWKYRPVTYETCGTVSSWKRSNYDVDWIIEQGYKYHVSVFMPKSVVVPDEWMPKIMEFNKRMGYRFFIHQMNLPLEARPGQLIETFVTMDNKGCAPIYRPYHFAFRFTQGEKSYVVKLKQDIRTWLPDLTFFREKFIYPPQLEIGKEVKVACAIVNDQDQPVVKLAIKPLAVDGWHALTSMDVSEKDSPAIDSWKPPVE